MKQCLYLGHLVESGIVRPESPKVEAISAFTTPRTKWDMCTFLGLAGYYRKFIPDFATIAAPLTNLTRKNAPNLVRRTPACDGAFAELKSWMCSSPILRSPNFSKPFIVQTDASECGVGAVLSQLDDNGDDHPMSYYSQKLLPRQERYANVEKECLAIRLAVQAFWVYLVGRPFTIQTDHCALESLDRLKDKNSRLTRWSLSLQPFYFSVQYCKWQCRRPLSYF